MAGYSGTPLPRKLGIKAGYRILLQQPADYDIRSLLEPINDYQILTRRSARALDMVLFFAESRSQLTAGLHTAVSAIRPEGMVWVVWPKKASQRFREGTKDLTEDVIRAEALDIGIVDVKVCAIDDTWSGLKLVYRSADR